MCYTNKYAIMGGWIVLIVITVMIGSVLLSENTN